MLSKGTANVYELFVMNAGIWKKLFVASLLSAYLRVASGAFVPTALHWQFLP
jgi:hypothetical protein